jgi:hypothetical protein
MTGVAHLSATASGERWSGPRLGRKRVRVGEGWVESMGSAHEEKICCFFRKTFQCENKFRTIKEIFRHEKKYLEKSQKFQENS